jgi:hypothetical protein
MVSHQPMNPLSLQMTGTLECLDTDTLNQLVATVGAAAWLAVGSRPGSSHSPGGPDRPSIMHTICLEVKSLYTAPTGDSLRAAIDVSRLAAVSARWAHFWLRRGNGSLSTQVPSPSRHNLKWNHSS